MGHLTTFTVYNDDCDLIIKHSKEFARTIYDACNERECKTYALGNHCNLITAQGTKHASEHTIYVHAGNTVSEMSEYSSYTREIMENNPEFFEEMLNLMERNVKELKKQFKEVKKQDR